MAKLPSTNTPSTTIWVITLLSFMKNPRQPLFLSWVILNKTSTFLHFLSRSQLLRRFLNFVNFPVLMWYEKFNWNLYSCSGLNDPNMPVYSINYHYTLGHMEMFLPTHWFSYHYVWQMNNYWLSWRTQINESFFTTHLYCLLLVVGVLAGGMLVIPCIATCLSFFYRTLQPAVRSLYFTSSVMKLIVSLFILGIWYVSRIIVPYYLYPSAGYLYFFLFYTLFGCIWIFGLNRGTNAILGTKMTCKHAVTLLSTCHFVLAGWSCWSC